MKVHVTFTSGVRNRTLNVPDGMTADAVVIQEFGAHPALLELGGSYTVEGSPAIAPTAPVSESPTPQAELPFIPVQGWDEALIYTPSTTTGPAVDTETWSATDVVTGGFTEFQQKLRDEG